MDIFCGDANANQSNGQTYYAKPFL